MTDYWANPNSFFVWVLLHVQLHGVVVIDPMGNAKAVAWMTLH